MDEAAVGTLVDLLERSAATFGARRAISAKVGFRIRALSHAELKTAMEAIARQLMARETLRRGDRVIVLAPNGIRTVAALFGLWRAGLVAVPLDANSTPAFVQAVGRQTGARLIIGPPALAAGLGFEVVDPGNFDLVVTGAPLPEPPKPGDLAEIVYTSGTTGDPKGTMLNHGSIIADVKAVAGLLPTSVRLELLSILPLSHMFEQTAGLFLPLLTGGSVHYASSWRPTAIAAELKRSGATAMAVVPRFMGLLLEAIEGRMRANGLGWLWQLQNRFAQALPLPARRLVFRRVHRGLGERLSILLCGGAALPAELARAWERLGCRVIEGYGATECSPVIASNSYDQRRPGSVGPALRGMELRIGEADEVQVRGPSVFAGYWQDAARTAAAFSPDGWFRTGDTGRLLPDGALVIEGRLAERIVLSSGMKVYPEDVEKVLSRQPGVRECAVLARSGPDGRDQVHAVIRPDTGAGAGIIAAAVEAANAELASHQRISGHTLWSHDLPRTALQKIKRRALAAQLSDQQPDQASRSSAPEGRAGLAREILARWRPLDGAPVIATTRLVDDLGLDSLAMVELGTLIEERTGKAYSEEAINALQTFADLERLLEHPGEAGSDSAFADWPLQPWACALRSLLQSWILFPLHGFYCRPFQVWGADRIDAIAGPVLIVANHASHVDTLSILRALPTPRRRWVAVAAASDYFFSGALRGGLASLALNAFAFSRAGNVAASFSRCGELADRNWSLLIYPEGGRSPDGRLLPFKSGIGLLAAGLDLPIVPVAVAGGHEILPKGASWPHRAAAAVRFGEPFHIDPAWPGPRIVAEVQARVAAEMATLAGASSRGFDHV